MNKYEENISDIITLDATEEIVDIFLESLKKTDKTIGIIANKLIVINIPNIINILVILIINSFPPNIAIRSIV